MQVPATIIEGLSRATNFRQYGRTELVKLEAAYRSGAELTMGSPSSSTSSSVYPAWSRASREVSGTWWFPVRELRVKSKNNEGDADFVSLSACDWGLDV
jgi:hypothetical protein